MADNGGRFLFKPEGEEEVLTEEGEESSYECRIL